MPSQADWTDLLLAEIVAELGATRGLDPDLAALRVALAVEDAFGIVLTDAEMTAVELGSPEDIRAVVTKHRGGA